MLALWARKEKYFNEKPYIRIIKTYKIIRDFVIMGSVKTITSCRLCDSKDLTFILSLGEQYVSDFIEGPSDEGIKVPLELVLCDVNSGGCGLLQLRHTTPSNSLYRNYWYKSGMNQTMKDALADITNKAEKIITLSTGDLVLDIGCNDGTLLRSYKSEGIRTIGFDPAENLMEEARIGTTRIINDFFNSESFILEFGDEKAKIITSIAMFYDLDEPNKFVKDIANCLDRDGIWIIQMSYLPSMLEQNAFDNICHEHLEYYSLMSLQNPLKRHELEVFDVELNDVNGGSFRTYVKHKDSSSITPFKNSAERVKDLENFELSLGLDNKEIYDEFAGRVNHIKTKLSEFIRQEIQEGKTVSIYGASTKGNTLLQYFELDSTLIKSAAEKNPDKWGKKTVGTLIPIVSEEEVRSDNPDYFLILPWHFLKEFMYREADYLRSGGKFIVPLPEFNLVGQDELDMEK